MGHSRWIYLQIEIYDCQPEFYILTWTGSMGHHGNHGMNMGGNMGNMGGMAMGGTLPAHHTPYSRSI